MRWRSELNLRRVELAPVVKQATEDLFVGEGKGHRTPNIVLTREQLRAVDGLAEKKYAIPGLILMENAGGNAARVIEERFGPKGKAAILCGVGNNGGDGCVIARHLLDRGWQVRVVVVGDRAAMTKDTSTNFRIVEALEIKSDVTSHSDRLMQWAKSIGGDEVVVDAMLGTGSHGEVRSPMAEVIDAVNAAPKRAMVAVDIPSGLDCDTGAASRHTICADMTVSFVAMKQGFLEDSAKSFVGEVVVADIGAPRELIEAVAEGRV